MAISIAVPALDRTGTVIATPDIGSELAVMSPRLLNNIGLHEDQLTYCDLKNVVAANAQSISISVFGNSPQASTTFKVVFHVSTSVV